MAQKRVRSFAIVTTAANPLLAKIHDRMPVILSRDDWLVWLDEEPASPEELKSLRVPYPAEGLAIWPVDKRVGAVKNKEPALIEPEIAK
jgi:putative SOS response-associated peptidase YedK